MKLVFWIVIAAVATILALFAASNRDAVSLALWPFGFALDLPLYLAILATFLTGFIIGAVCAWVGGRRWRREVRRNRRRITALERELAATQAQLPSADPALPARLAARG
jgi:uncharacterized integral membrane protein